MSKHETRVDEAGAAMIPPAALAAPRPIGPATQARLRRDLRETPAWHGTVAPRGAEGDGYEHEPTDGGSTGTAIGRRRQYHTSLEEEVIKELDELGRAAGLSRAAMIRVAVVDGLPIVRQRFRAVP